MVLLTSPPVELLGRAAKCHL